MCSNRKWGKNPDILTLEYERSDYLQGEKSSITESNDHILEDSLDILHLTFTSCHVKPLVTYVRMLFHDVKLWSVIIECPLYAG